MTRADRILITVLAIAALAAWPLAAASAGGPADSVTVSGPSGTSVVTLDRDTVLTVAGEQSDVVVVVENGAVRVAESACADHVCVKTGPVSADGAVIACVPNRVVVRVGGGERDALDARVR